MKISNLNLSENHEKSQSTFFYQMKICFFLSGRGSRSARLPSLAECGPQWRRQDGRGTSHRVTLCLFVRDAGWRSGITTKGGGRGGTPGDRPSSGCRVAEGGGLCSKKFKNSKIAKAIKFQFLIKISKLKKLKITKAIKFQFLIKTSKS